MAIKIHEEPDIVLTQEQRDEFLRLYNSGALVLGFPGHFYVWPFFMRAKPVAGPGGATINITKVQAPIDPDAFINDAVTKFGKKPGGK